MAKTFTGQERRRYPRLEEEMPVSYQTSENLGQRTSSTKNISGGGLSFEIETAVSQGDTLQIQIHKPVDIGLRRRAPIRSIAKVVWVRQTESGKYKSGLEFINIEEADRDEIISHVEEKVKQ